MQRTNFLHSAERLFLSVFSSYICSTILLHIWEFQKLLSAHVHLEDALCSAKLLERRDLAYDR